MPQATYGLKKNVVIGITPWKKNEQGYNYFEDSNDDKKSTTMGKGIKLEDGHSSVVADVKDYGGWQVVSKILKYPDAPKETSAKGGYKKGSYKEAPVTDPRVFELKELRDLLNREIAICSGSIIPPLSSKTPTIEAIKKRVKMIRETALENVNFIMKQYPFMEKKEEKHTIGVNPQATPQVVTSEQQTVTQPVAEDNGIKKPDEMVIPF